MAICPLTHKCRFFVLKMADQPEAADKVRHYYCYEYFLRCARFVCVRLTERPAPDDLLPNAMHEVAERFGWGLKPG